ncbi:DNA polymerase Y family protein [Sphingomonas sp. SUN019]|uniref:Y-family DNA polymerase n=1 Tax=Sphingomonas sp. SUN019 TaxID=2937788 RepID=UPI00216488B5|nr:DNA polymerase Y family protein [Sphingomonas sp. SUN019]UVO50407.1 DNA polymerase Y family protein [Sphingomonas sp. SUN019]
MKRVASLYLPHWSIDRVLRAGRRHAPPPDRPPVDLAALEASAAAERAAQCDAPRNTGWRPGAKWARAEVARQIESLPAHQRPPMRELGRRSEAAGIPFKRLPGDDGNKASGWVSPATHAAPATPRSPVAANPAALVTAQKIGSRIEIAAASPAARALGLIPGMALTQARASVPGLIVHDADPEGDRADLERLATTLARRWCPVVAISDDDGLLLDLTGVAHLHGGEEKMARRIVRLLARAGVRARIAVADTTGAAWAFARFPAQRHSRASGNPRPAAADNTTDVLPNSHSAMGSRLRRNDGVCLIGAREHLPHLAPLPVAALRLDPTATNLLARLGVDTIGELLAIPRAPLVQRFGRAIVQRLDQATGAAAEPLDPVVPPTAIHVERRFAEPIATADAIGHWLAGLVTDLTLALAKTGQGARTILFVAERVDSTTQTLRIGLARPTRDAPHILRLIARRIEEVDPGYGIDALALHVRRADPLGAEPFGAQLAKDHAPDLAPLVDTLANRIGPARLWRHRPVESDVPERSVAPLPPLDPPDRDALVLRLHDVRRLDDRPADHPWHPRWPRPARLLRRPERIDHVMAELPDQPPRRFTWRGVRHEVVRADGPERITGEWWRSTAERDAVRDYFAVENATGRRFWLFRRGDGMRPETGDLTWFIHGAFG